MSSRDRLRRLGGPLSPQPITLGSWTALDLSFTGVRFSDVCSGELGTSGHGRAGERPDARPRARIITPYPVVARLGATGRTGHGSGPVDDRHDLEPRHHRRRRLWWSDRRVRERWRPGLERRPSARAYGLRGLSETQGGFWLKRIQLTWTRQDQSLASARKADTGSGQALNRTQPVADL